MRDVLVCLQGHSPRQLVSVKTSQDLLPLLEASLAQGGSVVDPDATPDVVSQQGWKSSHHPLLPTPEAVRAASILLQCRCLLEESHAGHESRPAGAS